MKSDQLQTTDSSTAIRKGIGISAKLALAIVLCVSIAVSALLLMVYSKMSQALLNKSEEMLQTTTEGTLQEVSGWLNGILARIQAQKETIEYQDMDISTLKNYILHTVNPGSACPAGIFVGLKDGSLYHATYKPGDDYVLTDRTWYKSGIQSEEITLGDVYFDEDSQSYVVGASGILKGSGDYVRGVVAADIYLDAISDIVSPVRVEETGGVFLVDANTNIVIGHQNRTLTGKHLDELVGSMYSFALNQIRNGKTGLSLHDGTYIQVERVPGCNWVAVAYVSRQEVLSEIRELTETLVIVTCVMILFLILQVIFLVKRIIGVPVKEQSLAATRIAEGDLNQSIQYRSRDELGILANNFNRVTVRLREYIKYINEIAEKLHEIAGGNLTFTLENDYTGEFEKIKNSLDEISYSLNHAMRQIRDASREVALGAEQVSDGAMSLSQGSTEQASSVETLAQHINSVSGLARVTAQNAQDASNISQNVKNELLNSNDKMKNMTVVIEKISEKSTEIHKIVKTIEDIAFQTNILALNAAVEAARVGEAGKGFAVVADEVRTLAGKSSEAAQETTELLGQTVDSMAEGVRAAQDTAESMMAVVAQADEMNTLIGDIAEHTTKQAADVSEITQGIEQISVVIQSNAATSETSAAASEELSGQAEMLKNLVAKFRLKG